ncbi:MAG: hypothetical protein H7318_03180 [Oligoflexus sp.]|nr:hypothetical protein [Oligoflexus sp.]
MELKKHRYDMDKTTVVKMYDFGSRLQTLRAKFAPTPPTPIPSPEAKQ